MLALSIRQPWAWLILHAGKDIENRDWFTKVRGRILVHAGKGMTRDEYADALDTYAATKSNWNEPILFPPFNDMERGGIIGSVEIVDCVEGHPSPWFFGRFGFVLKDAKPMSFVPYRGALGFFQVPDSVLQGVA